METATKLIPDLGIKLVDYVKSVLQKKLKAKQAHEFKYKDASVYYFGDSEVGYVVLVDEIGDIAYFVRHKKIRHNGLKLGRQVLVWSNKTHPASVKFAQHVFFEVLLKKYTALIADQEQTPNGQRFWLYSLDAAFEKGLFVYFLDRRSSPNRLIPLHNMGDVNKYKDEMWGDDEGHKRTFAVISQKSLTLKSKT